MELNEKWKLTTQNNAYLWEGNQISKQNRYPCKIIINKVNIFFLFQIPAEPEAW